MESDSTCRAPSYSEDISRYLTLVHYTDSEDKEEDTKENVDNSIISEADDKPSLLSSTDPTTESKISYQVLLCYCVTLSR